jgi:hypothetical protein
MLVQENRSQGSHSIGSGVVLTKCLLREDSYQGIAFSHAVGAFMPITRFGALDPKDRGPSKSGPFSAARILSCPVRGPARPALSRWGMKHRSLLVAFLPIRVFPQPLEAVP